MKKKVVSVVMVLVMILSIINPINVFAGQADDIISKASGEVGYLEITYSNGAFWSKYGEWYGMPNGAWCAMFVSWCANKAGISTNIVPKFASVGVGVDWFKNKGQWKGRGSYTPKKGDIIFFGTSSHVGLVEKVSGNTVYTIEGNVHDGSGKNYGVRRLSYALSNTYIQGYGVPSYNSTPIDPLGNPVNIGDNFYAYIINTKMWKHLTYDADWNVTIRTETGASNQIWHFERQSDNTYKITSVKDGRCMEVHNFETASGANVHMNDYGGNNAQKWYIYGSSDFYKLRGKCTNCVLDVNGNNSADGTNVQMWENNSSDAQLFQIWKLELPKLEKRACEIFSVNLISL